MDTLNRDLGSLAIADKKLKGGSFLDIVGADVDSSFDKPMTFQLVQDTYHISQGGQTVGENANIQIQIDDDNCIHYLHKYAIVADLYISTAAAPGTQLGLIENGAQLLDGLEMSIGNVTWACSYQKYYSQFKMAKMGKHKMEYIANGLVLKHDGFAQSVSAAGDLYVGTGNATNALTNYLQLYIRQTTVNYDMRSELDSAGQFRVKIVVPLPCIFPALWELPDDGAIFTGLGQKLKFNIKTTQASDCVISNGAGAVAFHMQNVSLTRFYSKLDPIRADLVLKSSVQLPCLKYIHWQVSQLQPVTNAIFGISKQDRIRGLIFAFPYQGDAVSTNDATNVPANYTNNTPAQFKSRLGYFPIMPIQQVDIDIGGHTYSINMSQIQIMHLSNFFGDQKETYNFPIQRQLKYVYYLDLTRFGFNEDLYGSSSKNITSVHIQISLKTGAGSRTLYSQAADWDAASFQNFGFFGYLETQQMFEWRAGQYQSV